MSAAHSAGKNTRTRGSPSRETPPAGTPATRARVIAAHGRFVRVRLSDGRECAARPPGRHVQVVCGDEVDCALDAQHAELRIQAVAPRSGVLFRSNARGQGEMIASHVTLLAVVVAALPVPDFFIVDRYLAAAECAGIDATVLLNKSDLPCSEQLRPALSVYARIGLPVLEVSAATQAGMATLLAALRGRTAALVGQSGVGKSSLSRALVPHSGASVGSLLRDQEGRHTTTAVSLYELSEGGAIIDSPGVRDFAPAIDRLDESSLGFREIAVLGPGCRFADCRHMREPDCAVRAAIGGAMDERRYESYRRLRRLFERLRPAPGQRPTR